MDTEPPPLKTPLNPRVPNDYIIIVTSQKYEEACDLLLATLNGKWPRDNIIVVTNGSPRDSVTIEKGKGITVFTQSNIFEYTAFLVPYWLREYGVWGSDDDAFLLLHATSKALGDFRNLATKAFQEFHAQRLNILWCSNTGQCNICIIDRPTSELTYSKLGSVHTMDKMVAISMEWNTHPDSIKKYTGLKQAFAQNPTFMTGTRTPYASGIERETLHFPFIDVEKYFINVHESSQHANIP